MRFSAYLSVLATSMSLATASDTLGHTTNDSAALAETFSAADSDAQPVKGGTDNVTASKTSAANQVASKGLGEAA